MFSCCCCWFFFSYSFRSCCWSNYRHFGIEKQKERNCATRHSFAKKKQNKRKNWGKQHWEDSKRVNLSPCALWRLHTWSRGQTRMLCSKLTHNYTYPQSAWAKKNKQKQIMIMWIAFCGAWSGAGWQRPRPVKVLNCFSAYQPRSIDSIAFLPPHAEHARYSEFTRF